MVGRRWLRRGLTDYHGQCVFPWFHDMLCLYSVMAGLMWGDVCRYPWLPRSVDAIIGREPGHTICRQESGRPRYDARLSSVWSNRLLAHGRLPRAPLSVFPQTNEGTRLCFNR